MAAYPSHPTSAYGFSTAPDPFAGLSRERGQYDVEDAIDFEDTYDGLGDRLHETGDDLNDDTFGATNVSSKPVGKDFDFFGRTAEVSGALSEEHERFSRQTASLKQPPHPSDKDHPSTSAKPVRSGYEKYHDMGPVADDLQVDANLWGGPQNFGKPTGSHSDLQQARSVAQAPMKPPTARQMLSLEEVEAQMQLQATARRATPAVVARANQASQLPPQHDEDAFSRAPEAFLDLAQHHRDASPHHLRDQPVPQYGHRVELPAPLPHTGLGQQFHQQSLPIHGTAAMAQATATQQRQMAVQQPLPMRSSLGRGQPIITHPDQLMYLSEKERHTYLQDEARRAKRNHKIFLLSKDNGLMTPQDKSFISRIQLQQLMAVTGTNEADHDSQLNEDFYYQVLSQIRGGPRQNPHQPLSHFAQLYLLQTGGRQAGFRRYNRGGDNHIQRMAQQVQRAVEAAKARPKNKQLVIEGSLGKISFSNAKTPKPLLNIKRPDTGDGSSGRVQNIRKSHADLSTDDRKTILKNIERVYGLLMKVEDMARKEPPPPSDDQSDPAAVDAHVQWSSQTHESIEHLWKELKVLEPIQTGSTIQHPFIAFLSYAKGKKAIPRVFRYLSNEQRVTMLTMIVIHLDILDVVRNGQLQPNEIQLPATSRDAIDLFSATVTPALFSYVSEAPIYNIIGLLGLILDRVNVLGIAHTKVGLGILTMLSSRATLIRNVGEVEDTEWQEWVKFYNRLFDTLEPILGDIFPGSANSGDDIYVWQFLAAIGSGANSEQQQRLVLAVKDRVMETVNQAKLLPPEMSAPRLGNVNLFMRAIGLDVELLG